MSDFVDIRVKYLLEEGKLKKVDARSMSDSLSKEIIEAVENVARSHHLGNGELRIEIDTEGVSEEVLEDVSTGQSSVRYNEESHFTRNFNVAMFVSVDAEET